MKAEIGSGLRLIVSSFFICVPSVAEYLFLTAGERIALLDERAVAHRLVMTELR
jgi:hypothetical protein